MITTTLNRIRAHGLHADGWQKLLAHLGKTCADEPLPFSVILEATGLDNALLCCQAEPQYAREWRLFAVWCARRVQHLMSDRRSIDALDVAERYATGQATDAELETAWAAAGGAWAAAGDAGDAARDAAWDAAWAAAWDAGEAWVAAWAAEQAAQTAEFLRVITETEERQ